MYNFDRETMIIGICGGSGSGKTTLLKRLSQRFKTLNPSVFSMDNYYKPIHFQHVDENGEVNFDLPSALNENQLVADLNQLVKGEPIEVIEYHFNAPPDKNVLITIQPSDLVIVEGLFLFHYPGVKNALDFSVFIDVDLDVQLDRRLYRDQETRGYTRESILYQWKNHVTPCYTNYLLPYRDEAHFKFRNDHHADEDFEKLVEILEQKLNLHHVS
ncbi:MAG: uridine kinase [Crocinitomicaceae bacterium]|nr:MAG: uridine kinase [Crocinitomicaceae bacterium]